MFIVISQSRAFARADFQIVAVRPDALRAIKVAAKQFNALQSAHPIPIVLRPLLRGPVARGTVCALAKRQIWPERVKK
jgi:hypothetical protein